jgi:CheR methyltransferase, SAM binding domain.
VISPTHKILEIVWPPFVFNTIRMDKFYIHPLNRLLKFFVEHLHARPILNAYKAGQIRGEKIQLFAPAALALAHTDPRFTLGQHDLLQAPSETDHYQIVRAMNVLNPSYFNKAQMQQIINNILHSLQDDGLLITGSNQNAGSMVNGAVYKKQENQFIKLWQSGTSSPVHQQKVLS